MEITSVGVIKAKSLGGVVSKAVDKDGERSTRKRKDNADGVKTNTTVEATNDRQNGERGVTPEKVWKRTEADTIHEETMLD